MTALSLTVVSVLGPRDGAYWELAHDLLLRHLPKIDITCHLVDNYKTIKSASDASIIIHRREDLQYHGASATRGSIEHSRCLNHVLAQLDPRDGLVLVMDPDFFVVDGARLGEFINELLVTDLAMLASTWHRRWVTKSQQWVAPHFVLFDASKIAANVLDFSTGFELEDSQTSINVQRSSRRSVIDLAYSMTLGRLKSGSSPDTGHKIAGQVLDMGRKVRLLMPRNKWHYRNSHFARCKSDYLSVDRLFRRNQPLRGSEIFEDRGRIWGLHLRKQMRTGEAPSASQVRNAVERLASIQPPG